MEASVGEPGHPPALTWTTVRPRAGSTLGNASMPVPPVADSTRPDSLASRLRARRQQLFIREMAPQLATRILDVGGTERAWRGLPFARRVVILNLVRTDEETGLCPFVFGDALAMPFADRAFDLVFSNSVIEHVGGPKQQECFAHEIRRVGSRYWVQAPNRYFPLEPHFLFPGFQFLPKPAKLLVGRLWPFSWLKHFGATDAQIEQEVRSLCLPSAAELRRLFPGGRLRAERVLGLTKSLVVYFSGSS